MRSDRERLLDILGAIEAIEKYACRGYEVYLTEELIHAWIVQHIQIIGEATANLSPELRSRYPEMPWPDIIAMRNVLFHQYFGVDLQEVWDTVTTDLPLLKRKILAMLKEVEEPSPG